MDYLHDGAHEGGSILHRDLKSANVLVTGRDVVKITDFGLSRLHYHTTRMAMGGTIAWMAPEAIRCTFSKGGDVWSFGVVVWEMITQKQPFEGIQMATLAWLIASKEKRLPIPASCPAPFRILMEQCWERVRCSLVSFSFRQWVGAPLGHLIVRVCYV
jgi:serine/threonine protein kinase